jgi:hypothetical protein
MLPEDIGHAAAYEAYRTWIHNSSIYEPLSGDSARQREGLIGLAVAEGNPPYSPSNPHLNRLYSNAFDTICREANGSSCSQGRVRGGG